MEVVKVVLQKEAIQREEEEEKKRKRMTAAAAVAVPKEMVAEEVERVAEEVVERVVVERGAKRRCVRTEVIWKEVVDEMVMTNDACAMTWTRLANVPNEVAKTPVPSYLKQLPDRDGVSISTMIFDCDLPFHINMAQLITNLTSLHHHSSRVDGGMMGQMCQWMGARYLKNKAEYSIGDMREVNGKVVFLKSSK